MITKSDLNINVLKKKKKKNILPNGTRIEWCVCVSPFRIGLCGMRILLYIEEQMMQRFFFSYPPNNMLCRVHNVLMSTDFTYLLSDICGHAYCSSSKEILLSCFSVTFILDPV